jgi:hypothetical protein
MLDKIKYRRFSSVLISMIVVVVLLTQCMPDDKTTISEVQKFDNYATAEKCASCHADICKSYEHTAHNLTGQLVSENNIKGSFKKGTNTYAYSPDILLSMEKRGDDFFQVPYFKEKEKKAMKFDIVIGSGVMGQSFLTWRAHKLFQLPITYFTAANQWSNSPGFPSKKVMIDRPVTARCLECHVTFAEGIEGTELEPTAFNQKTFIYNIDCQKCHGLTSKHVEYQQANPGIKLTKFIVNPSKITRQQQIDVCGLCHGGNIQKTKPSFTFTAGKNLSDYFDIDSFKNITINTSDVDVHGNQVGLLQASKCYKMSNTLTCNNCHNTHENERGNVKLFSQRCMNCHNISDKQFLTPTHVKNNSIKTNCIDCHMPSQQSKSIAVFLEGEETPRASLLRSHLIGIYAQKKKQH